MYTSYEAALLALIQRISDSIATSPVRSGPVRMYLAGGAAVRCYGGTRATEDMDASFSARVALPTDLAVTYRDEDGRARMIYFDTQYNESFALLHERAHDDALPLELEGIDREVLDVRILSPLDLAVSKIARLSDADREDIATLAGRDLVNADDLRRRAEEAVGGYVGDVGRIRNSITIACRIVRDAAQPKGAPRRKRR